jgi:hypothetical protein
MPGFQLGVYIILIKQLHEHHFAKPNSTTPKGCWKGNVETIAQIKRAAQTIMDSP